MVISRERGRGHNPVYECFTGLRARELSDGLPLLVLGTEVTQDPELAPAEWLLRS